MLWYQMAARMYNGSGSLGGFDLLLTPFYERDTVRAASSQRKEPSGTWPRCS